MLSESNTIEKNSIPIRETQDALFIVTTLTNVLSSKHYNSNAMNSLAHEDVEVKNSRND